MTQPISFKAVVMEAFGVEYPFTTGNIETILSAHNQEVSRRVVEELKIVYREITKNDVAGQVKWYVNDRIKELEKGQTHE